MRPNYAWSRTLVAMSLTMVSVHYRMASPRAISNQVTGNAAAYHKRPPATPVSDLSLPALQAQGSRRYPHGLRERAMNARRSVMR